MTELARIIAPRLPSPKESRTELKNAFRVDKRNDSEGTRKALSANLGSAIYLMNREQIEHLGDQLKCPKPVSKKFSDIPFSQNLFELLETLESVSDRDGLNEIASQFLNDNPVESLSSQCSDFRSIYEFFQGSVSDREISDFLSGFSTQKLERIIVESPERVTKHLEQAVCALASNRLGRQPYDLLGMAKSVVAFDVLARHALGSSKKDQLPAKLIRTILSTKIAMPEFLFGRHISASNALQNMDSAAAHAGHDTGRPANDDPCDCDCDAEPVCTPPKPGCPELQYFVADYLTLEATTKCYALGDMAFVANVAAYESTTRKHTYEEVIETTFSEVTTDTTNSKRDLTLTDRSTVAETLENKMGLNALLEGKYGKENKYILSRNTLTVDKLHNVVRNTFKEQIDKTVIDVNRTVVATRKEVITTTEKEENTHTFSNATATPAKTKYFFADKLVSGQVLSYALRGQIEMLLPKPSVMMEYLQNQRLIRGFGHEKPVKPGLTKEALKPENHAEYMTEYGLENVEAPPVQLPTKYESVTMLRDTSPISITIPAGYTATKLDRMSGSVRRNGWIGFARITLNAGSGSVSFRTDGPGTSSAPLNATGSITCTITRTSNVGKKSSIVARITLTPQPMDYGPWQDAMYDAIISKYEEELAAYEKAFAEYKNEVETEWYALHPEQLEQMIRTELKRATIYMMCENFVTPDIVNLKSIPCGAPTVNRLEADEYLKAKYFWDLAFDWELMTFHFFDYLFGHQPCEWPDKFFPSHDFKMYSDFMSAGRARLLVPVADGMEDDVAWFVQTGEIWGQTGEPPLNLGDPRYIQLTQQIAHSKNCFQTTREGLITGIFDQTQTPAVLTHRVRLTGTDAYWDPLSGTVDTAAILADINRQIYIDGEVYVIADITLDPLSPPYSSTGPSQMQWIITLERVFEGNATLDVTGDVFPSHPFAVGALLVGAPFTWKEWTNMVCIGDVKNPCLPCYPIDC